MGEKGSRGIGDIDDGISWLRADPSPEKKPVAGLGQVSCSSPGAGWAQSQELLAPGIWALGRVQASVW